MRPYAKYLMLLAVFLGSRTSHAQRMVEAALSYTFSYANTTSPKQFWQNGGSLDLHGQLLQGVGVVRRLDALHTSNMDGTGVGLDLVTVTFGPRLTWSPHGERFRCYGEASGGPSKGFNSEFPTGSGVDSTSHSGAFLMAGGANYGLSKRVAVRLFDVHWMRTYFPNATTGVQNTLVAGTGIVFHLR